MSDIVKILPYSVDLSKPLDKTDLHTLFVMGDNQAHRFELAITNGGKNVDLSGSTVTAYFTSFKEDTTVEVTGSAEGNKAIVTLSKPCYTLHGQFVLFIQIKTGDVENTVFQGDGYMRSSKGETIIYDDYIVYDVNTLLTQISAMKTATEAANKEAAAANEAADRANKAAGDAEDAVQAVEGWENAEATVEMLSAGSAPVVDVETAADGHRIIKMQLPIGNTGATPQITFQVKTGAPGTDVQIEQNGTAEEPVILLTIPRGDTGAVDGIDYYESAPKALGTASPGTANGMARGDHVHPMPTAEQVGARPNTWTPTASDVGALPSGGTAVNSTKLGGSTWAERLLEVYPVGSIYLSVNSTSPAALFGGTWEQLKDRFLLGAGGSYAVASVGGEANVTLTTNQMPAHTHELRFQSVTTSAGTSLGNWLSKEAYVWGDNEEYQDVGGAVTASGGNQPHNNMPPYLAVYMWKRVS